MNGLNYHDEMVHKMMDKEEARARLITMAQNESLGLEREALIIGANALVNNENLWLEAHDKRIRTEVIDEVERELLANGFIFTEHALEVWHGMAEQLKEHK